MCVCGCVCGFLQCCLCMYFSVSVCLYLFKIYICNYIVFTCKHVLCCVILRSFINYSPYTKILAFTCAHCVMCVAIYWLFFVGGSFAFLQKGT